MRLLDAAGLLLQADLKPESAVDHVEYSLFNINGQEICVIPGTKAGTKDVYDNLRACRKRVNIGGEEYKVHQGFWEQSERLFPIVGHCDLFLGHSLGGAIAQICALRFQKPVITLGSPRVGNKRFASHIKDKHTRIKGRGDWVTHVPPWWFGYKHGGNTTRLGSKEAPWWKFWSTEDHYIPDYIEGIKEYLGK